MKNILTLLICAFLSMPAFAASPQCANDKMTVHVNGMVCDFCAQSIKKTLLKEDGVDDVQFDLTAKTVTFDMKDGKTLKDDYVTDLIKQAGYEAVKIDHACAATKG